MKNIADLTVNREPERLDATDYQERAWASLDEAPDCHRAKSESQVSGALAANITSTPLTPTDFSTLR